MPSISFAASFEIFVWPDCPVLDFLSFFLRGIFGLESSQHFTVGQKLDKLPETKQKMVLPPHHLRFFFENDASIVHLKKPQTHIHDLAPGARFSTVPVTFRGRKSKCKE